MISAEILSATVMSGDRTPTEMSADCGGRSVSIMPLISSVENLEDKSLGRRALSSAAKLFELMISSKLRISVSLSFGLLPEDTNTVRVTRYCFWRMKVKPMPSSPVANVITPMMTQVRRLNRKLIEFFSSISVGSGSVARVPTSLIEHIHPEAVAQAVVTWHVS